jgi:hypothetical protein
MNSSMSDSPEKGKFTSWRQALDNGTLSPEQISLLDDMILEGQAGSREAAASMLDWQDAIINKPEHMYGF